MYINQQGYLERKTGSGKKPNNSRASKRNWFLVKSKSNIDIGTLYIPNKYVGKRIRIKPVIELLEE